MVISAVSRAAAKLKAKKYFVTHKARDIKKKVIKRGKDSTVTKRISESVDAVKIKKTTHLRRMALTENAEGTVAIKEVPGGKQALMDRPDVMRRHVVIKRSMLSPFVLKQSEEVMGDPIELNVVGGRVPDELHGILSQSPGRSKIEIKPSSIHETVVSVKGSPKKIIAFKRKDQLESGYNLQGLSPVMAKSRQAQGKIIDDFADYPVRPTSIVFGIGFEGKSMKDALWGIASQSKRSIEITKHEGMESLGIFSHDIGWRSFHIKGIMVGNIEPGYSKVEGILRGKPKGDGPSRWGNYSWSSWSPGKKGIGMKVVKDSGEFFPHSDVYTFGKLTSTVVEGSTSKVPPKGTISSPKPVIKPLVTFEHHFDVSPLGSNVEHLTFKIGTKKPKPLKIGSDRFKTKKEERAYYKWLGDSYGQEPESIRMGLVTQRQTLLQHRGESAASARRRILKEQQKASGVKPFKFYTTIEGTHAFTARIPTRKTRKKIKRVALPAFAAAPTGFIFYSGIKQKAKKKKKGVKR